VHAADATGRAVETPWKPVRARNNVQLFEHHAAIDLITARKLGGTDNRCLGAYILDSGTGEVDTFLARFVVIATGGASKVYLYTSNPDVATGDGIAMAGAPAAGSRTWSSSSSIRPACITPRPSRSWSPRPCAARARAAAADGDRFMPRFDQRAELAPRDIVARAIDHEMKRVGSKYVLLDISHRGRLGPSTSRPSMRAAWNSASTSPASPSRGAGGPLHLRRRLTDASAPAPTCRGSTPSARPPTPACTAPTAWPATRCWNAWSSPSWRRGHRAPRRGLAGPAEVPGLGREPRHRARRGGRHLPQLGGAAPLHVGLRRHRAHQQAPAAREARIDLLRQEIIENYSDFRVETDLLELRNLVEVADLIVQSAQRRRESRGLHYTRRRESRGLHYTLDFPHARAHGSPAPAGQAELAQMADPTPLTIVATSSSPPQTRPSVP
jgi:L-aspartate oxidase